MNKLVFSTIASLIASAGLAFGASEMGFSWGGTAPSQDAQPGDADLTVALYSNGVAVVSSPDADGQPQAASVVVPQALANEFEDLESTDAIAARAQQLVAQGNNPQVVAAAAIQANRAIGGLPSGDALIAQTVLSAAPTASPQQQANIIGYGVELITNPQTFAGIVEGLRSAALAGNDDLAVSSQQLDAALAAANLVAIVNATPEFTERLSLAPLGEGQNGFGEGVNANRIGTGLAGGTGQTNPILTGLPTTPIPGQPTPTPAPPTPTPTPEPPVTPTQNL